MALQTFQQFGMVEIIDGVITIPNWGKHQNLDQLESKKQYMRNYMKDYREKQKALTAGKPNCKTNSKANVSQADKEEDKELDLDLDNKREKTDFQSVVDLFHRICISFPKIRSLTDSRKKDIKDRLNTYTLDDFKTVFENAEASSFLKGSNDRNWTATFDWLIKDANMAKVLEGNFVDRGRKEKLPDWFEKCGYYHGKRPLDEDEIAGIRRMMSEGEEDDEAERDQLARELQESFGRKEGA